MGEIGNGESGLNFQAETKIKTPVQETSEPTENLVENFGNLFYKLGQVTSAKYIHRSDDNPEIKRPLFARNTRARLYNQFKETPKGKTEERSKIIHEAHLRDEITRQYLNQGEITVALSLLGEQKARFISIVPPESTRTPETESKSPIFLIPGISNDIECVGGLVHEMAMRGRRVVVVAHPESFKGRVTKEFADAVEKDNGFGPHVEFFKQAIDKLMGENEKLELWGYSAGAPIIESILNDPKYQAKTENAVLLCPASSVDQSKMSMNIGIINEFRMLINRFKVFPSLSYTKGGNDPKDAEQIPLRKKVFGLMMNRVMTHVDYLKNARVREGGNIVIVSGRKDRITKSSDVNKEFLQNPQVRILDLQNGYHASPGVEAEKILPLIFNLQKSSNPASSVSLAEI